MFSLNSERAIKFYNEHPELDFNAVNLIIVDLLEKLVHNMSNTLNQNLSLDMLKEIYSKLNHLEQKTQDIDATTKNYVDSLKLNVENSVSSQKEFILNSLRDLIQNDSQTNYININKLFSHNYEQLSTRIATNLEQLPKEVRDNTNTSIIQLTNEIQKTHAAITNEIQNTAASTSGEDLSIQIATLINAKYTELDSAMKARIETMMTQVTSTNTDILERVKPIKQVEEYFSHMNNSNRKGKHGEAKLEPILASILPDAEITNSSGTSKSGDFIIKRQNKHNILIDTKDWDVQVRQDEVTKIIRDIDKHKCNGILMSQHSGIALKSNWEINIHNNFVLIFLHNVEYDEHKIATAIQVIDTLYPIIQQQANLEHESITTDQLIELNREFQEIISKKLKIIDLLQQNNNDVIREIGKLDIPSLSNILKSKFSQPDELTYRCDSEGCAFIGKNSRSIAAHKKKHLLKQDNLNNYETSN
jgi:hypothetical protein